MRARPTLFLAVAFFLFSGCAVQRSKAPQISPQTAKVLNFATLVSEAQADYKSFFTDVGARAKAGQLSAGQVAALNAAGSQMRDALDAAGALAKTYAQTGDQSTAARISAYLQTAAQAFATLYQERAGMLAQTAAVAPAKS